MFRFVARCRAHRGRRAASALTLDTINPAVVQAEYAVRGELVLRAAAIKQQLQEQPGSLPIAKVLECNIGNPQAVGQVPLSFGRQVQALLVCPQLLDTPGCEQLFAPDAIARAKHYLAAGTKVGAYSESQGLAVVRQEVAEFIAARDGVPASKEDIFLTDGASKGVEFLLKILLRGKQDGVLCPIPQYPLYSAALALAEAHLLPYELDEANGWSLPMDEVRRSLAQARADGVQPRALVVINPGNPTGNCLPLANMQEIVRLCAQEGLVLMADEVYQENTYGAAPFFSFKKVASELGAEASGLQLVSFHSVSKGFLGECGMRGGYFELHGFDPDVKAELLKLVSIGLCSNVLGQTAVGLMVNPPRAGDASHATYAAERDAILGSLKRRALKLVAGLNALEGVTCNEAAGAMYAFPSVTLPEKAQAAARAAGKQPDTFYALALLEATGIVVVPGSGFRQKAGTWHFRTTFLPPEEDMDAVIEQMTKFHAGFMAQYA